MGFEGQFRQLLDEALEEPRIRAGKPELLAVPLHMGAGNRELLGGHVHTDHLSPLSNQLGEQIGVAA